MSLSYKTYKTLSGADAAIKIDGRDVQVSFMFDDNSPDYQEYLIWLSDGNTPE